MKKLVLSAVLCAVVACAYAQHPSDSLGDSPRRLGEVEVVATRVAPSVRSSRPVQTLDADYLERAAVHTLSDAVRRFAGVDVRDYGGVGGMKTVSVRNLGANHTAVSYDGVTVSNTQAGQIDLSRFATDHVRSITLSVGEDDALMQSARHRASAAVIALTSSRPTPADTCGGRLSFRTRVGSWGLVEPQLHYALTASRRLAFAATASYMRADGRYPYRLPNGSATVSDKRHNTDIYSWLGEANMFATFGSRSRLDVKAQWYSSSRGLPGAVILYNTRKSNERMQDEEFFAQAVYAATLARGLRLEARAKYVGSWSRYTDTDVKYAGGRHVETYMQREYYASATLGWTPLVGLDLAFATDAFVNTLNQDVTSATTVDPRRLTWLTSVAARWTVGPLRLDAALVGTLATEHVESDTRPSDRRRLSPAVSASLRLLRSQPLYLRAMYKHTFRLPTFNDMYYAQSGTLNLRPENADEYNVGLTWSASRWGCLEHLALAADVYHNDVDDKIVAFPTLYVWKMANFGRVDIDGLNVALDAMVRPTRHVGIGLRAAYMLQRAVDTTDKSSDYYKSQIPYTPRHSGSATLSVLTPWADLTYTVVFCGSRNAMRQATAEYELDPYAEHTMAVVRDISMRRCDLRLQLALRNLTDERYEVVRQYPMPGRSVEATATLTL